jgi:hypothetical protein
MKRTYLSLALGLTAMGLAACNNGGGTGGGNAVAGFCPTFKSATTNTAGPLAVSDPHGAAAEECDHRWAHALAPSRDAAGLVAAAAVGACSARLGAWNQTVMSQGAPGGEAMSIISGQPTNPVAEHNSFLHGRALLYVVEARAGHCAPPPISNNAPNGA